MASWTVPISPGTRESQATPKRCGRSPPAHLREEASATSLSTCVASCGHLDPQTPSVPALPPTLGWVTWEKAAELQLGTLGGRYGLCTVNTPQ